MSDLVGNPEDRFSRVAAHMCLERTINSVNDAPGMSHVWARNERTPSGPVSVRFCQYCRHEQFLQYCMNTLAYFN